MPGLFFVSKLPLLPNIYLFPVPLIFKVILENLDSILLYDNKIKLKEIIIKYIII